MRALPFDAVSQPKVRAVIVNYDGGAMTLDCLRSLVNSDWPADRLEIVLVDNASIDGVIWEVRDQYPAVTVIESLTNEGFARGCNMGIGDLGGVDYVALLNNDAVCAPTWIRQLVETLEADPTLGAACGKILLTERRLGVRLDVLAPEFEDQRPRADERLVRLSGVRIEGCSVWDAAGFSEGVHPAEAGDRLEPQFRWLKRSADVYVAPSFAGDAPFATLELRLMADVDTKVRLRTPSGEQEIVVRDWPEWVAVRVPTRPVDIVNSAGSELVEGGFGHDRGFREMDFGQYDEPADVFAWCGGAVVLRGDYLRQVGTFDPRFFLYYEDTELSWRGQLAGWRYRYVPDAVVRHRHAASTVEGSDIFRFWVERNRLLMLTKVAPAPVAKHAWKVHFADTVRTGQAELERLRRRRAGTRDATTKLRSLTSAAVAAPLMLVDRVRLGVSRSERDSILRWQVPR